VSSSSYRTGRRGIGRVLNASDVIFDETKIVGKHLLETELLTQVLRSILPDTDADITKHQDFYPSEGPVNK
jgi:hypothetical protein